LTLCLFVVRFAYRLHPDIAGYFLNVDPARLREDLFRRRRGSFWAIVGGRDHRT